MRAALEQSIAGRGGCFLISGEPGIGKTRLADELAVDAASRGARVAWGRCWEGGGAPAYWPWVEIVRSLLFEPGRARQQQMPVPPEIGRLIPELAAETTQPQPSSDLEQGRFRLFDAVATLVKQVARSSPLVLILDDLHEADRGSLDMFKFVARGLTDSRIVIVGTYRDAEVHRSSYLAEPISEIVRHGHPMPLAGLAENEVVQMIERRAERSPSATFASELHRVTAGNPLFVDGVIRVLAAERKLGTAEHLDLNGFKLPEGVRGAIRKRLALLSAEARSALALAAVIGQIFDVALLERVNEESGGTLAEVIREAAEVGVVEVASRETYRFTHPLIREALYEDSTEAERMRLHRATGDALEQMHAANLTPHLAALAHHFHAAGIVDKAIDYSIRAGEAALVVFAYDRAISDFETALELIERCEPHSPLLAQVMFRLGAVTCFFSDRLRGLGQLESALELYNKAGDELRVAEIHSLLGLALGVFNPHMNVSRALSHFERAEPVLARTAETHSLGLHYWGLAMTNFEALKIDEALAASERAIEIFNRLGDERWSSVTGTHCQYLMLKGKHAEARALLEKILLEATRLKDPGGFRLVMFHCGWYFNIMGDPRRAINFYRSGLKRQDLDVIRHAFLLDFLASAEVASGNIKEATAITHETKVNRTHSSVIAFFGGDWDSASELLQEDLDWARNASSRWNELNSLTILMGTLRIKGDFDGAMSCFEQARRMFGPDNQFCELRLRSRAVLLFVDAGRPEMALEHLQCCRAILAQGENWLGHTGTVRRGEAMMAASMADFGEADRHFASAVEISKKYSLPWDEAETLHYWGRALNAAGKRACANEKFDAAIELYRRHGAGQRWIDRVEAARIELPAAATPLSYQRPPDNECLFRREGDYWTISYGGVTCRLKDMKGLGYIAHLIAHPGQRIHVLDLFEQVGGDGAATVPIADLQAENLEVASELGDASEVVDSRARAEYRRRLSELHAELEEAERNNDIGRAERTRNELDSLTDGLRSALGLGGRSRRFTTETERARGTVSKSIRVSLERIKRSHQELGTHLSSCIHTGYFCAYLPDPERQPSWRI